MRQRRIEGIGRAVAGLLARQRADIAISCLAEEAADVGVSCA